MPLDRYGHHEYQGGMRLLEQIMEWNHRNWSVKNGIAWKAADYSDSLPIVALTCIDPRLNRLLPDLLGIPEVDFIWLRNAGNIVHHPLSSTMRSLALACLVKGAKEIMIIGHSDCRVTQFSLADLENGFVQLNIDRRKLPSDLADYFGLFNCESDNVVQSVDRVRRSPLIGPNIPVHGLVIDVTTGRLKWTVDGYAAIGQCSPADGCC
jgi:carbonic anhydrase